MRNGVASATAYVSLTIYPCSNGFIVRDAHTFMQDPMNQTPHIGTHVFLTPEAVAEAIPTLLKGISMPTIAKSEPNSGGTGESLAAEPPAPLEQD